MIEYGAEIVASVATTLAAILVALNLRARITGFGFIIFCIGSIAWIVFAGITGQAGLLWQNIALLFINLVGVWRWLGIRARYERGARAAAVGGGDEILCMTATQIADARVLGSDEAVAARITEVMYDMAEGRIAYAALAVGGRFGVGEQLLAISWQSLCHDRESGDFRIDATAGDLERLAGFDKDRWPRAADDRFDRLVT